MSSWWGCLIAGWRIKRSSFIHQIGQMMISATGWLFFSLLAPPVAPHWQAPDTERNAIQSTYHMDVTIGGRVDICDTFLVLDRASWLCQQHFPLSHNQLHTYTHQLRTTDKASHHSYVVSSTQPTRQSPLPVFKVQSQPSGKRKGWRDTVGFCDWSVHRS